MSIEIHGEIGFDGRDEPGVDWAGTADAQSGRRVIGRSVVDALQRARNLCVRVGSAPEPSQADRTTPRAALPREWTVPLGDTTMEFRGSFSPQAVTALPRSTFSLHGELMHASRSYTLNPKP